MYWPFRKVRNAARFDKIVLAKDLHPERGKRVTVSEQMQRSFLPNVTSAAFWICSIDDGVAIIIRIVPVKCLEDSLALRLVNDSLVPLEVSVTG